MQVRGESVGAIAELARVKVADVRAVLRAAGAESAGRPGAPCAAGGAGESTGDDALRGGGGIGDSPAINGAVADGLGADVSEGAEETVAGATVAKIIDSAEDLEHPLDYLFLDGSHLRDALANEAAAADTTSGSVVGPVGAADPTSVTTVSIGITTELSRLHRRVSKQLMCCSDGRTRRACALQTTPVITCGCTHTGHRNKRVKATSATC